MDIKSIIQEYYEQLYALILKDTNCHNLQKKKNRPFENRLISVKGI